MRRLEFQEAVNQTREKRKVEMEQLLLSQVGVEVNANKIRKKNNDPVVTVVDYTFEFGVSKQLRKITQEEGYQKCIEQVQEFILK